MSNVTSISGRDILAREPNQDLVEHIEDLLEMAKSGEIIGMCEAALYHDETAGWGMAGGPFNYTTLGAVQVIQAKLANYLLDRDET